MAELLVGLSARAREFVVALVLDGDGVPKIRGPSAAQIAGAQLRLTIEARIYEGRRHRHYRLGRLPRDDASAHISCRVGPIAVKRSQVLAVADAKRVFEHFLDSGELMDDFDLDDITAEFDD